ncbi:IPT/TIG domain-containing protein [Sinomicrobium weinanense]|uniref:IPT/TIG domain-containing protein n=1 Tax=Sinomicrobium weinanense TaxID=2842200 RepID=A0A926JTV8_9FLAO|nr:IPT/TIG domain-containing protein [Sinomicrobium weinanense]MBC9797428.1 IPT/TIG domain-containing protein [Sinomicrobium weinanense]MBU3123078.1 IPT/TIG domain-containing protein [Sinomicrobium weinanense]
MKNIYIFLLVLAVICSACNSDDDTPGRDLSPMVMSVSPGQGKANDVITIYGRNFSTARDHNKVTFNEVEATVLEATKTRLEVVVPEGEGQGEIGVVVQGQPATGSLPAFNYIAPQEVYMVATLAGSLEYGLVDGQGTSARFRNPEGVAMAPDGNIVVTDRFNNSIRLLTPEGMVTTITGNGTKGHTDGPADQALLNYPWRSCVDREGNIYVADRDNHAIRKISTDGIVSTVAGGPRGFKDGPVPEAQFNQPIDVDVDDQGNLYVADNNNHRIRKISPDGMVSTVSGSVSGFKDGNASEALFANPSGISLDVEGNIYVADRFNHRIRKISTNGEVTSIAGQGDVGALDGDALSAQFNNPYGLDVAENGDIVVADLSNHKIRLVSEGAVTTIAGTSSGFLDGAGFTARFYNPTDVAIAGEVIYVADLGNHLIRKITRE